MHLWSEKCGKQLGRSRAPKTRIHGTVLSWYLRLSSESGQVAGSSFPRRQETVYLSSTVDCDIDTETIVKLLCNLVLVEAPDRQGCVFITFCRSTAVLAATSVIKWQGFRRAGGKWPQKAAQWFG